MRVACCSDSVVIMERWAEVAMGYSHGRVCHAVAGAMKGLIQDWNLMIVQLEHQMLTGHLTLQVGRNFACMLALSVVWGKWPHWLVVGSSSLWGWLSSAIVWHTGIPFYRML